MTIHELYTAKQKQYQDYQVQQGIYEKRVEDSINKLKSGMEALRVDCAQIADPNLQGIQKCLMDLIAEIDTALENITDPETLQPLVARLDGVSASLESTIREALQ